LKPVSHGKVGFFLFVIMLFWVTASSHANAAVPSPFQEMTAVLHVHSEVSGSRSPFEELVLRAREKKIDAIVVTDYFQQRVELGWHPFDRWLKVWYEKPSIQKYGFQKYYEQLNEVDRRYPDVVLIPGAEVTPAYWWSGSLFNDNLKIHNLQKNILAFGLDQEEIAPVPTVGNRLSSADAYHGGKERDKPYQEVIDYVREHQGFAIWSTPDENPGTSFKKGPIHFQTDSYTDSMHRTKGYDGIAIFPEGYIETGNIGGAWDSLLGAYTRGKRAQPVWAFAELILHDIYPIDIDTRLNVAWVKSKSKKELFEAFRKGRFYIVTMGKTARIVLNDFVIEDEVGNQARSGEEFTPQGKMTAYANVVFDTDIRHEIEVNLIRGGSVVHTVKGERQVELEYVETTPPSHLSQKSYYRLMAIINSSETGIMLSNPIFVSKARVAHA